MNEERFIETLLRRYAKKRRADAGAPLEMHPATRRLLRAEVARRFGNAAREEAPVANAWLRFWRGWGRQLAWATPVLVAAGVIVWALQQETAQPDSKSLELRQARSAAPATPMNIEAQPPVPANRSLAVTEPAFAPPQPARAPSTDSLGLAEKPAVPPPAAAAPVVVESFKALEAPPPGARLLSEAAQPPGARPSSEIAAQRKAVETAPLAPDSVRIEAAKPTAPEEQAFFARRPPTAPTNALSQAFVNAAPAATTARRAPVAAADRRDRFSGDASTHVLARFQLVQVGNQIEVVDADGSVYVAQVAGQAETAATAAVREATASAARQEARGETARRRGAKVPPAVVTMGLPQMPLETFTNALRAVGTNRTLNQQVEFVWNFAPLTNGPLALRGQAAFAPAVSTFQNVQLPLPPSVGIVGRARIGNTQEIEVRAVPENSQ